MWENEKIRGANNLGNSKCDTHKHNVLNDWVPHSHKNKIVFMCAGWIFSRWWKVGDARHDHAIYK